ncbi:hypothetical protein [Ideonella sp.]|uniref:hypothetical protein n=1 Tax=Ideonella sp. TaxID=1929293 RepID=UPI0035B39065
MVDLTLPDAAPAHGHGDVTGRLVARVQAWQHRHPLARRLPAADVTGFGVIALPYAAAKGGGRPQPLFHQPSLVPGLSHRALVEFAQRHAVSQRPGPADWPQRDVERADASAEPAPLTRYLLTAAVTEPVAPGALPRRLLIAPEGTAIWGPRPLSRPRVVAALLIVAAALLGLAVAGWGLRGKWARPAVVAASAASAPAASAPVTASPVVAASPASAAVAKAASAPLPASAAVLPLAVSSPSRVVAPTPVAAVAPAVASAVVSGRAASAPKTAASAPLAAAPAAVPASAALTPPRAASAPPIVPPPLLPMPSARRSAAVAEAASEPAPAASVALPAGPHFALVSVPSKKRAGAEATLAQVRKVLGPAIGNLQAQIMPSPEGFVVTIWPLPTQADAERLAEVLGRRGVPMKWLEF